MTKTALCEEELFYGPSLSHLDETVFLSLVDEEALETMNKIHELVSARYNSEQYSVTNPYLLVNSQHRFQDGTRASLTINMVPSSLDVPLFRAELSTVIYNKRIYQGTSLTKALLACQEAIETYLEADQFEFYSAEETLQELTAILYREQR